ncbi:Nn.00g018680.m01.CDS01 [Neocucurbitaria sp. VM-36]
MSHQLDTLPPEILFNILSFTEPTCNPTLISYPLNALAETNKYLNTIVEEYARGLLKQHANITPPKSSRIFTCRRKWLGEICQFCNKPSKRRAILYPTLTCCRACDKEHFPKMTMTKATQDFHLSKLDLFTPNTLHPRLPRLAIGIYAVMGGTATMIAEADVLARRDHIYKLLGRKAQDASYMRNRPARHHRIIKHLDIMWSYSKSAWRAAPERSEALVENGPKSMRTEENRKEYARKAIQKEWAAIGMSEDGMSQETAIELD